MRLLLVANCTADAPLRASLRADQSVVTHAETVVEAMELLRQEVYDLVLLDVASLSQNGYDLIGWLRTSRNDTPLVAVTGSKVSERVKALSAGADDAIAAPVNAAELWARVISVVRRSRRLSQSLLQAGDLSLCLATCEVRVRGAVMKVTPKEFSVLELLILCKGSIVTKDKFLEHLYGGTDEPGVRILDVFICKLRRKLSRAGLDELISTIRGLGYTIRATAANRTCSNDEIARSAHLAA